MNQAVWWLAGAVALARILWPRAIERRHARRFAMNREGIVVGAEPIDLPRPGAPAVLVMHGGGDTPQSMAEIAAFLHGRGYAVRAPLLANHGRALEAMSSCDAGLWRTQARGEFEALRAKHPWVGVVGQSVGGALALDLAASLPDVRALVLLAPWVTMPPTLRAVAKSSPLWQWLIPYLPSLGRGSIYNPKELAKALTHGIVTPSQLRALADIADVAESAAPGVRAATLTIQSREDHRIAAAAAQLAFERLGAPDKRFEWLTGAGHVISVDFGKERVFALAADWLDAHRD